MPSKERHNKNGEIFIIRTINIPLNQNNLLEERRLLSGFSFSALMNLLINNFLKNGLKIEL